MYAGISRRDFLAGMAGLVSGCLTAPGIIPFFIGAVARESPKILTHFPALDGMLGGIEPSELILLAGRPDTGKSLFALDLATNISSIGERSVGYFSLWRSGEWVHRMLQNRLQEVRAPHVRESVPAAGRTHRLLGFPATGKDDGVVWIDGAAFITMEECLEIARWMKTRKNVGIIVVDYLQLMGCERSMDISREQEIADQVRGFKSMAKDLGIPIILQSGLSRKIAYGREDRRPRLADALLLTTGGLGGYPDGNVEPCFDVVMFAYRNGCRFATCEGCVCHTDARGFACAFADRRLITEIIVAKNRHGATGTVEMKFDPRCQSFVARNGPTTVGAPSSSG